MWCTWQMIAIELNKGKTKTKEAGKEHRKFVTQSDFKFFIPFFRGSHTRHVSFTLRLFVCSMQVLLLVREMTCMDIRLTDVSYDEYIYIKSIRYFKKRKRNRWKLFVLLLSLICMFNCILANSTIYNSSSGLVETNKDKLSLSLFTLSRFRMT